MYTQLFDPKVQIRVLEFGLLDGLKQLLEERRSDKIDRLSARLVQRLCRINQGRKQVVEKGLVPLLLFIMHDLNVEAQSRDACCVALLNVSQSREGVNYMLNASIDESLGSVVQAVTWVLDSSTSQASPNLLLHAIQTLTQLCTTPVGRAQTAECGALLALNNILNRDDLGTEESASHQATITRDAAHLVGNICLNGPGKAMAKDLVPTLGHVLQQAIQTCDLSIMRRITCALMTILVHEPAKPRALQQIPQLAEQLSLVDVLCKFLDFCTTQPELFEKNQPAEEVDSVANVRQNVLICLRLLSELPEARQSIQQELDAKYLSELNL